MKIKNVLALVFLALFILNYGCDSFSRKFTRKKSQTEVIEPVLDPEENAGLFYDSATRYQNYFVYWRSWHDELVASIETENKKSSKFALKNLEQSLEKMRLFLQPEQASWLDEFMSDYESLEPQIVSATSALKKRDLLRKLSVLRLRINKQMHIGKVRDWIIKD